MSREKILDTIRKNKPSVTVDPPSLPLRVKAYQPEKTIAEFEKNLRAVGGIILYMEDFKMENVADNPKLVFSLNEGISKGNLDIENARTEDLEKLDVAILNATVGVAENGALWVPEENMGRRLIPFITKDLILTIRKDLIVDTMHDAYDKLADSDTSYGVFISGPSKTADIEQALVIGAQGHLRLYVIIEQAKTQP